MSQAVQRAVALLTILVLITAGIAVFAWYQKINLQQKNQSLQTQLTDVQTKLAEAVNKSQKLQGDLGSLTQQLDTKQNEKNKLQSDFDALKAKMDGLMGQLDQASHDRSDWKNRLETIRRERDELMRQLQNRPEKIVYKEKPLETVPLVQAAASSAAATASDAYWANILRQKATLEVELNKARADLDKGALQVAELKKQNSDLQIQIKALSTDKDQIEFRMTNEKKDMMAAFERERQEWQRKVKDEEDMAGNLSLEAARARSDQKSANEFANKIKDNSSQLQSQFKQLVATKVALEKTVARLTQEKADMSQKLAETEGIIQDRINEIWQIKKNLDQKISQINEVKNSNKEVELPPIVVNAAQASMEQNQVHKILSINEKNNFVIIDYGQAQGSNIGRVFKAYRDGKEIASLQVIQVRRDISAADIMAKQDKLQVGDLVR